MSITRHNEKTGLLEGGAVHVGAVRDSQAAPDGDAYFHAYAFADQNGSILIEHSQDGVAWFPTASASTSANTPALLKAPALGRYNRVVFTNSPGQAQASFDLHSAYTAS